MVTVKAKWVYNTPCSGNECSYDYMSIGQRFVASQTGYYKLEAWGAQGGSGFIKTVRKSDGVTTGTTEQRGGYGGYSVGTIKLNKNDVLYIYTGGKGGDASTYWDRKYTDNEEYEYYSMKYGGAGGFNGGGRGGNSYYWGAAGGGGGATHIAKENGELATLSSKQDKVLIVAGGGGGNPSTGGWGGGSSLMISDGGGYMTKGYEAIPNVIDSKDTRTTVVWTVNGATQNSGYAFGKGQDGRNSTGGGYACNGTSGGGGGWYGGDTINKNGQFSGLWGTGGSGYIGNSSLSNKAMYMYNRNPYHAATGTDSCTASTATNTKTVCVTTAAHAQANAANSGNGYAKISWVGTSI